MIRMCAATLFAIMFLASTAPAADAPDIAGRYAVSGDNGNGTSYAGTVEFTKEGEGYLVKWATGNFTYTGVGVRDENTVAVAIRYEKDPAYSGIIVYRIGADGVLKGRWTATGYKGKVLTETLTPAK